MLSWVGNPEQSSTSNALAKRRGRETGATAVFAEEDVWPYARRRDTAVAATVPLRLTAGLTVHPSDVVRKADGGVYTVFTPYSRAWKALPPPRRSDLLAPQRLASACLVAPPADPVVESVRVPTRAADSPPVAGNPRTEWRAGGVRVA